MNFGSLFSGIGGFDLGFERAGMTCKWQVENDRFCTRVLKKHWPDVERFGDIREFSPDRERHVVDVICGGFPCQDLSVAGKRAGLAGERSGLFWEFVRVASVLRPAWLVLENVPGLLSSNAGRDMGTVVGALADIGYCVCWRVLDSQFFGVAQHRRRVFIVGHSDPHRAAAVLFEPDGGKGNSSALREVRTDIAYALNASTGEISGKEQRQTTEDGTGRGTPICIQDIARPRSKRNHWFGVRESEIQYTITTRGLHGQAFDATGMRDIAGISGSLDMCSTCKKGPDSERYKAIGNAVTVSVAEWIGKRIVNVSIK